MFLVLPIFNFSSSSENVKADSKSKTPLTQEEEKSVNDLFLYNAYVSGNHFADSGTEDGPMAVKGNATIPEFKLDSNGSDNSQSYYDYAGTFSDGMLPPMAPIVGQVLTKNHKTAMLLGGNYTSYATRSTPKLAGGRSVDNPGWLVVPGTSTWVDRLDSDPTKLEVGGLIKTMDQEQTNRTFEQLDSKLNLVTTQLSQKITSLENAQTTSVRLDHGWLDGKNRTILAHVYDAGDSKIALINLDEIASSTVNGITVNGNDDSRIDNDSRYLPTFHLTTSKNPNPGDEFLQESDFDQVIVYSTAKNFVFNDNRADYDDDEIAQKITYYLPNANQVTSFTNKKESDGGNKSIIPVLPDET